MTKYTANTLKMPFLIIYSLAKNVISTLMDAAAGLLYAHRSTNRSWSCWYDWMLVLNGYSLIKETRNSDNARFCISRSGMKASTRNLPSLYQERNLCLHSHILPRHLLMSNNSIKWHEFDPRVSAVNKLKQWVILIKSSVRTSRFLCTNGLFTLHNTRTGGCTGKCVSDKCEHFCIL